MEHETRAAGVLPPFPEPLLRGFLVLAQAATVLLTWKVWVPRTFQPMLPLVELPGFPAGWAMLESLAVVLVRPRAGPPLHAAVLAAAIIADQSRLQPHVISLATLLWATTGTAGGRVVTHASLAAL